MSRIRNKIPISREEANSRRNKRRTEAVQSGFCSNHFNVKIFRASLCQPCWEKQSKQSKIYTKNRSELSFSNQYLAGKITHRTCKTCQTEKLLNPEIFEKVRAIRKGGIAFSLDCIVCKAINDYKSKREPKKPKIKTRNIKGILSGMNLRAEKDNIVIREKIILKQLEDLIKSYYGLCAYCCEEWDCIDHIVPLSRFGSHTIDNLVPCCWRCNMEKRNSIVGIEWISPMEVDIRYPDLEIDYPRINVYKAKKLDPNITYKDLMLNSGE